MAIPHVYSNVLNSDFTMNPIKVHKQFIIQRSQLYSGSEPVTSSGYSILEARYPLGILKLDTDSQALYETNSFDGSYKSVIWKSLDAQYYRFPYDAYKTLEHSNPRFTYKYLGVSASVISIPYLDFGESIKPGSVQITASNYETYLSDDGNGNLYDNNLNINYSYPPRHNLVAYWGFNDEFRKFKNSTTGLIVSGTTKYTSHVFEPDQPSIVNNVNFVDGLFVGYGGHSNIPANNCGFAASFESSSIITYNRSEFNFGTDDDFTISFWIYPIDLPSGEYPENTAIISKNTMKQKQMYGYTDKYNANDLLISDKIVSSVVEYDPIDVYPYRFEYDYSNSLIRFLRSDGSRVLTLFGVVYTYEWTNIIVQKTGGTITLYINGDEITSTDDFTENPINRHSIVFGKDNIYEDNQSNYNGYLDEVRIYNTALDDLTRYPLSTHFEFTVNQSPVVGNIFYKTGKIVISPMDINYQQVVTGDFTLKFQSTHVIYAYECLVRIPAGSFNLSQNPSALKNPNEDLIIDEMTGSLSEGALFPYATAIGLYNDKRELMAIAKLSQPLQMRDDVNLNISIKWDS